jgi:hypothetical protein
MISELKNAIFKLSEYITTVDRFYYNQAPLDAADSYITFYMIDNAKDGCDTGNIYTTTKIQFNVFVKNDSNGDACDDLATELKSVFINENLSIEDNQLINIFYDRTFPSRLKEKVWQSTVLFSIHVRNTGL